MEIRRHKKLKNIECKESGRNGRKFVPQIFTLEEKRKFKQIMQIYILKLAKLNGKIQ